MPDDAKRVILINVIIRAMEWGTYIAMSQDCAAEEIADLLLFETGTALLAGDFDRFSACFGLPHVIETADKRSVIALRPDRPITSPKNRIFICAALRVPPGPRKRQNGTSPA